MNNNLSNVDTLVDTTIKCIINERDKGALKIEINNQILSTTDDLNITVYLKGESNDVSTKIYYKENNQYVLLDVTLEDVVGSQTGIVYSTPISSLNLQTGVYKIVFTNGKNEEIVHIIIK